MTEQLQTDVEFEWPERWTDAADAPPLARAFLEQIERFESAPSPVTRLPHRSSVGVALAVGVVALAALGALYFSSKTPSASETPSAPDGIALVPANDPLPTAPEVPPTPPALVGAPMVVTDVVDDEVVITPATRVRMGHLLISSTPIAVVEVDGVARGNTPRRIDLLPGRHVLRLTRPEFGVDATETIEIEPRETLRIARHFDMPRTADAPRRMNTPPSAPPSVSVPPESRTSDDDSRYRAARACAVSGMHPCVIERLRGHATTAREFELLIASMRASSGYDRDLESTMRTYLSRFPTGRQAGAYRAYLVAHSGD